MMKIGRNAPCPCGSGKKYKHCCLNKAVVSTTEHALKSYDFVNETESPFEYINGAAERISSVLSQYKIEDVSKAVYCINAWKPNRSALAQCFAANKALCMCSKYGSRRIDTYNDLVELFHSITEYSVMSNRDDKTIDDFGEIFINYAGITYPIITGTGHLQVYPCIRFLPYVCEKLGKQEELLSTLSYLKTVINALQLSNNKDQDEIVYEIPSEDFWRNINDMFDREDFAESARKIYAISERFPKRIESTYGYIYEGKVYPLWNPGLLVDFYHSMEPDNTSYPKEALLVFINSLYCKFDLTHKPIVLLEPVIVNRLTNEVDRSNNILFTVIDDNTTLVFMECKGELEEEDRIKALERKHREQSIDFVESFRRDSTKGNRGCSIPPESTVQFIKVYPHTDAEVPFFLGTMKNDHRSCTYLDLICLFGFSQTKEIIDYFTYKESVDYQLFTIGSISNEFFMWKRNHHYLTTGAIEPTYVSINYNETEQFIYDYFKDELVEFPHNNTEYFSDPLEWDIIDKELGYSVICRKGQFYLSGFVKKYEENISVFIANSYQFFEVNDSIQKMEVVQKTLRELCQRLFNRYVSALSKIGLLQGKVLHLLYVPVDRFSNSTDFPNQVQCSIIRYSISYGRTIISIRYTIDIDHLFEKLKTAKDRTYENRFFLDLIKPFQEKYPDQYKVVSDIVNEDENKKKTVSVNEFKQYYYFSPFSVKEEITESSLLHVKKEIATVCLADGILPGEYHGKQATDIIRKIQIDLVKHFEAQIASYDKMKLHYMVLQYYSHELNEVYMQKERYFSLRDLDEEIQQDFLTITMKYREENRRNKYTAEYLIESNLSIVHSESPLLITGNDFNYLLAFADWLCALQEISDICYQRPDDSFITVNEQYIIDTHRENDVIEDKYKQGIERKYAIKEYGLKFDDEDKKYITRVKEAFILDTGIDYELLLSLLEYICLDLVLETGIKEIETNVYSCPRKIIVDGFMSGYEVDTYSDVAVEKTLDFIILNESLLKTYGDNKSSDVLPTWEREARKNRFEVKPIIKDQDNCVFSPVVIYQLLDFWRNGLLNWFPPYEIGLTSVKAVLEEWKKRYEGLMVQDIKEQFINAHFDQVFAEIDLDSRFPREDFPKELGDYDVLCINESKREIWLIESKVFHKVGSVFEDLMLQKSVFVQHRYDEKFQRRIDYIKNTLPKIIRVFNLQGTDYNIIPYMVTNKMFYSRYKPLSFEIISFSELQSMLMCG